MNEYPRKHPCAHFLEGEWVEGKGSEFRSLCPATSDTVWVGTSATPSEVDRSVVSARAAFADWACRPTEERIGFAERFAEEIRKREDQLARLISREMGKPVWESRTEVAGVVGKVNLTIQAMQERRSFVSKKIGGSNTATWYRPLGVIGVLGPFNLPAHLPNGHIVPALLAGNTVVFKPSDQTPAVGQLMVDAWNAAGIPPGVLNLVQGKVETAQRLAYHSDLDGLLFTGSHGVGLELSRHFGNHPEKLLALELGGNNPLVVHDVDDIEAAVVTIVQSAFITSGQRCTCARRLILVEGPRTDELLNRLLAAVDQIRIGASTELPEPFMGPVVSQEVAERLMRTQDQLCQVGGQALISMGQNRRFPSLLSPGLIDVTGILDVPDEEWFGPLLQVLRVPDFDEAINAANSTKYGLSAGLLSDSRERYDQFRFEVKAGIINWNRPTTGASGALPFGGVGKSGNHRPSGYFAIDFCSDPVASLESTKLSLPENLPVGILEL